MRIEVIPLIVGILLGLVGLGLLALQNEFVALRACGVSMWQIAAPLVLAAAVVSLCVLAWNETVVPYSARQYFITCHQPRWSRLACGLPPSSSSCSASVRPNRSSRPLESI